MTTRRLIAATWYWVIGAILGTISAMSLEIRVEHEPHFMLATVVAVWLLAAGFFAGIACEIGQWIASLRDR